MQKRIEKHGRQKIEQAPQTTRFDKPGGSPQELGEFLIRSVGSRKNPSRDNAQTFDKNHNCPLHSVPKGFIQISSQKNKRNVKSQSL